MLSGTPRIAGGSSGGGGTIGGTVDTNEVAYGSALDTLTSDSGFIRQAGTLFQATATTATNSYPTQTTTGKLDFGLGLLDATGHSMNSGDDYVVNAITDGASFGATGLLGFNGYINDTTGGQTSALFSSNGSLFGQSGPSAIFNATDDSTYTAALQVFPTGARLFHADGATYNNSFSAGPSGLIADSDGDLDLISANPINVNNVFTIPNSIAGVSVGDVLTYTSAGVVGFQTPTSGTPDLYVENATIAFDSTATGANGVTIGGTGHLNAGTRSLIAGGRDNEIATAVNNAFIGGGQGGTINANNGFIAGGFGNTTNGGQAFAQGTNSIADGNESSAFGTGNTSESFSEMAVGLFGTTYTPGSTGTFDADDRVFNVGNGTAAGSRSDAFTILKNGDIGIGINNFEANNNATRLELNQDIGFPVQRSETVVSGVTDNSTEIVRQGGVATTNATPTNIEIVESESDHVYQVETSVTARRTGGTGGTAGDGASYKIIGTFKNIGGTVTQIGTTTVVHSAEDQAAWDVDFNITTVFIQVQVTGAADNNISWTTTSRIYEISS